MKIVSENRFSGKTYFYTIGSSARRPRGVEARARVRGLRPLHRGARHQLAGRHLLPVERRIPRIVSHILPGNWMELLLQGDTSGCSQGFVDIKIKVVF